MDKLWVFEVVIKALGYALCHTAEIGATRPRYQPLCYGLGLNAKFCELGFKAEV